MWVGMVWVADVGGGGALCCGTFRVFGPGHASAPMLVPSVLRPMAFGDTLLEAFGNLSHCSGRFPRTPSALRNTLLKDGRSHFLGGMVPLGLDAGNTDE